MPYLMSFLFPKILLPIFYLSFFTGFYWYFQMWVSFCYIKVKNRPSTDSSVAKSTYCSSRYPSSVHKIHILRFTIPCNSRSRECDGLLWPPWAHAIMYILTYRLTYIKIILKKDKTLYKQNQLKSTLTNFVIEINTQYIIILKITNPFNTNYFTSVLS